MKKREIKMFVIEIKLGNDSSQMRKKGNAKRFECMKKNRKEYCKKEKILR